MYLGFIQLLSHQGPWSVTAALLVLMGMQSPGEAVWDGDVQEMCRTQQGCSSLQSLSPCRQVFAAPLPSTHQHLSLCQQHHLLHLPQSFLGQFLLRKGERGRQSMERSLEERVPPGSSRGFQAAFVPHIHPGVCRCRAGQDRAARGGRRC